MASRIIHFSLFLSLWLKINLCLTYGFGDFTIDTIVCLHNKHNKSVQKYKLHAQNLRILQCWIAKFLCLIISRNKEFMLIILNLSIDFIIMLILYQCNMNIYFVFINYDVNNLANLFNSNGNYYDRWWL